MNNSRRNFLQAFPLSLLALPFSMNKNKAPEVVEPKTEPTTNNQEQCCGRAYGHEYIISGGFPQQKIFQFICRCGSEKWMQDGKEVSKPSENC